MTYQIDRFSSNDFDAGWPVLVNDETVNNSFGLNLLGRGVTNYGELIAENFVYLLENFAGNVPPANPVTGQFWYNSSPSNPGTGSLNIWNGSNWDPIGGVPSGGALPATAAEGDLFYLVNTSKNQLYAYGNSVWNRVGGMLSQYNKPSNPNDGDLWFDTSLPNNKSASNKQRIIKVAISGAFYPIALGDPSGGAANNTSVFIDGGILVFKSNNNILGAWSNAVVPVAPASISSFFPNGLQIGLNLSNFSGNQIISPKTGSKLNLGTDVSIDRDLETVRNLKVGGFVEESFEAAIIATGTTAATAKLLSKVNNFVTGVTPTGNGVRLPDNLVMPIGSKINVWNVNSVNTLYVYPKAGGQINGGPANIPFSLGAGGFVSFFKKDINDFRSMPVIYG